MLQQIVALSLRYRGTVIALASALALYGLWTADHAKLDVLPDFAPPQVVVQTEAPGFAPDQVERLVTLPIEAALGGMIGLASLRSESIQGLSVITALFTDETDVYLARQVLSENLADVSARLPLGVSAPQLSPLTSATMDVLKIGLVSSRQSPMELRTFADWTLRPRLLMVPGVARVNIFGGEVLQLQLQIDPPTLQAHGIAMNDIVAAARSAAAIRGAGFIDTVNQRLVLEASGNTLTAADLAATLVASSNEARLRLGDVATVTDAPAPMFGDALIQGESGVLLTLSAGYGTNTMDVTHDLEHALAELGPVFEREGITVYPALHRPASFVENAIHNLSHSLLLGGILVVFVLIAFLQNWRAAFISLTAIPLSLLTAVIILTRCGLTLNTMSLGGLAIAIGEVVDDAIVDVENILRRVHENAAAPQPRPVAGVVLAASLEVRQSVTFATLAVALAFLPLLTLGGLQGKFFAPLALSYLLAVLASLAIALVVTPALALVVLGRTPSRSRDPHLQAMMKAAYRRLLLWVWRHERLVLAGVGSVSVIALLTLPFLGGEFLPDFKEHHLVLQVAAAPGTSLAAMRRIGQRLSRELLDYPLVETAEQQIGRAEQGEDTWGPNRSEFHVELRSGAAADDERATEDIRALLAGTPGIQSEVLTFLGDRISETITGETAEVVVNVFGADLDVLDAKAREIAAALGSVRGAVDVNLSTVSVAPAVSIRLRPDALRQYGFTPAEVLDQVQTAFAAVPVGQTYREDQPIDLVVVLEEASRTDPGDIGTLLVRSAGGVTVPLGRLVEITVKNTRDTIRHEGGQRRQTVTCNVRGRDVASFVDEAQQKIKATIDFPAGTYVAVGGTAHARAQAQADLLLHAAFGLLGVVLLLSIVARHWRNLALLLLNLPLALAGGVAAVAVTSSGLSLGSLVGFVTLFGITNRNAIMMLSHYQHLVHVEGLPWTPDTVLRGATDRLVPIIMTALVTALGLLPVALASTKPGGEIDGPMATVILGGLITSTVLNLLVFPTLAMRHGRFEGAPTETA